MTPFRAPSKFDRCSFRKCIQTPVVDCGRTTVVRNCRATRWSPLCAEHLGAYGWELQDDGAVIYVGQPS